MSVGALPADHPVGRHHSVSTELPALLTMLAAGGHAATFFVEAWNAQLYPDALRSIAAAGHEIGWHGWRHEAWHSIVDADATDVLARSRVAFDALGLDVVGARPPGGLMGPHAVAALQAAGYEYVSLAGRTHGRQDGAALLPFPWAAVDGSYYFAQFARLRVPPGDGPVGPEDMLDAYATLVDDAAQAGSYAHPTEFPEAVHVDEPPAW